MALPRNEVPPRIWVSPCERIVVETALEYGLKPNQLLAPVADFQSTLHSAARHDAIYRCAMRTKATFSGIAKLFNGCDHSTITYAIQRHAAANDLPLPRKMKPYPAWREKKLFGDAAA